MAKKKTNEHRLYHKLSKLVVDWMVEENKKGRKPFQSEIVGALEMVKADIYALHSIDRLTKEKFEDLLKALNNKKIKIDDTGIIIESIEDEQEEVSKV